jgi:4a-hydroxytetrahydrobiopterin dehydratase
MPTTILADYHRRIGLAPGGATVVAAMDALCTPSGTRSQTMIAVRALTCEVLEVSGLRPTMAGIALVPILRAGLSMWHDAYEYLGGPPTVFIAACKRKGTGDVELAWRSGTLDSATEIVVLDPILATGDTACAVLGLLRVEAPTSSVHLLSCYAAPAALDVVGGRFPRDAVTVAARALASDQHGFLIPPTHGDLGDKLFGG